MTTPRKLVIKWVYSDELALEIISDELVVIHQRNCIDRDKWETLLLVSKDLRALADLLDKETKP